MQFSQKRGALSGEGLDRHQPKIIFHTQQVSLMIYLVREQLFVGWDNHLNLWPLRYNFPVWLCVQITHKFVSVSTDPKIHAFSFTFFWVFDKSSVDYDIYQTFWWIFNQSHPYLISNQLIGCIHLKASFADFQKPQFVLLKFPAKN